MRALVGTLYCGENEFDSCTASIAKQVDVDVEHVVIRDLPNREAHIALYDTFMRLASTFDMFVKVDADMVIKSERFLHDAYSRLQNSPGKRGIIYAVHDFFTDRPINGLHVYTSDVQWLVERDTLFVDPCPIALDEYVKVLPGEDSVAEHCPAPHEFQCYHFGLHKALKVVECRKKRFYNALNMHTSNIMHTWEHYQRTLDRRLGLACLGAESALSGAFGSRSIDYDSSDSREAFERVRSMTDGEIRKAIRWLRMRNLSFLGTSANEVAMDGVLRFAGRRVLPRAIHSACGKLLTRVERKANECG